MSHHLDPTHDKRKEIERKKQAEAVRSLVRDDVVHLMSDVRCRRAVQAFLEGLSMDASPFNTNAMAQSYRVGQQDAGKVWLGWIREFCPQLEIVMRMDWDKALANLKPADEIPED